MTEHHQTYYLLSLGCAKNLVDADSMAQLLRRDGYREAEAPEEAGILIVNTCGFVDIARQESITALRKLAERKRPGQLLVAAGCLTQYHGAGLAEGVAGLDGLIGTRRWMDIPGLLKRLHARQTPEPLLHLPAEAHTVGSDEQGVLRAAVQGSSAYLKIADGCRRPCAFCAIPAIKGTHVSRPPERIVAEAAHLNALGVQEIVLISQDTTDYGHDIGLQDGLPTLLEAILAVTPDVPWLRIMYAYPGYVTPRLIEVMAREPRILPYLDMPLQHAHRDVLKRMRRPADVEWVYTTIEKLRAAMPDIAIRTTFIVGYPGETEEAFDTLLQFLQDLRFDRVGAFTYSREPGTPGAELPDQLPDALKHARYERLMQVQQPISHRRNQAFIGQTLPVLVEGYGDGLSVGRTYRDAPEIDGVVLVEGELPVGKIVAVRIIGATTYDLIGQAKLDVPSTVLGQRLPLKRGSL